MLTPQELRAFPLKDKWSDEETLALIEVVDGTELIAGTGLPLYVRTREDRVRWASCVRIAAQASGEPVASVMVGQTARIMYSDRDTYTD
jgi:hypothetical protein